VGRSDLPAPQSAGYSYPSGDRERRRVRGAFRPEAWNERVSPLADIVDLLGSEIDNGVTNRFRHEYLERYFGEWQRFATVPKEVVASGLAPAVLLSDQSPYVAILDRLGAAAALEIPDAEDRHGPKPYGT